MTMKKTSRTPPLSDIEKRKLEALLYEVGPGGMTFTQAHQRRRRAIKTIERYLNKDTPLTEQGKEHMNKANGVVNDKELEDFVERQLNYRKRLGIAPMTREDHLACTQAKAERRAIAEERGVEKRKLSHSPQPSAKRTGKKEEVNTQLRLALVDTGNEDGKISEERRLRVEGAVLDQMISSETCVHFEGGWVQGHRSMQCGNEESYTFFLEAVRRLHAKEGRVKAIPWSELHTVSSPKGWIWVPRPYMSREKLMKILKVQNPQYNTASWSVVLEGKQKTYGQHFLLKFPRKDLSILKERNMVVWVGLAKSTILMDGSETDEPRVGDIPEFLEKSFSERGM